MLSKHKTKLHNCRCKDYCSTTVRFGAILYLFGIAIYGLLPASSAADTTWFKLDEFMLRPSVVADLSCGIFVIVFTRG